MSRPSIDLPKLRSFHGIALPGFDGPALGPSATPGVPMRVALDGPRPPSADAFRVQLPEPPPRPAPPVMAPPRLAPSHPPTPKSSRDSGTTPVYKPPTMMPFFDQPIVPHQPGLMSRLLRWVMMILISSVIGAAMGVGIWYQFFRRVG